MRKVREVLRLKYECVRSHAEIAAATAIGETTVGDYLARARSAGLTWAEATRMTDSEVEARLFRRVGQSEPSARVPVDFAWVHRELSRVGVTLQTLWVALDNRHYSVPYALVGEAVEIRATVSVVEILHRGTRVASHPRHYGPKGAATIADEHRPRAHREYGKWPPERVVAWAESIGGHVGELASAIMGRRTHPETGYRACLGVIRLADRYGHERVDAACARAVSIGSPSFKTVQSILKSGLDRTPLFEPPPRATLDHDNIRGASYFDKEEENAQRRDDPEAQRHEALHDGRDPARDGDIATGRRSLH